MGQGSVSLDFRARADGHILRARGEQGAGIEVGLVGGSLVYEATAPGKWGRLEAEDTRGLDDGRWHSLAVVVDASGTHLYVDGYLAFCGTTTVFLADLGEVGEIALGQGPSLVVADPRLRPEALSPHEVMTLARSPEPAVEFAANRLSPHDVAQLAQLRTGSVYLRFRVRGKMQAGTLLAAGAGGQERLVLSLSPQGIHYCLRGPGKGQREVVAQGGWSDGAWHEVALVVGHGAVDIYVDGFRQTHEPGQFFLADVTGLDEVVVGQDCQGVRLSGEAQRAYVFDQVLSDAQVKRLGSVEPVVTHAVFDRGYHGSASYRIPSILTLASGTVLAGADQRVTSANDSPNDINFVVRRSTDAGHTWEDLRTVIDCPGTGPDAASVIDSCMVQDPATGRVLVLIDHFTGAVGAPNCVPGTGFDAQGRLVLRDLEGERYTRQDDGTVLNSQGEPTGYHVDEAGDVTDNGKPAGNVELAPGADPAQSLFKVPTSYLQLVFSDDDGLTWSTPRDLNPSVKEDWMPFLGTCPGNGIVLRHGPHRGRILIPVYYNNDQHWLASSAAVVYSDDHGESWHLGHSPNQDRPTPEGPLDPATYTDLTWSLHEATVVERQDGSILMLMRNQHPSAKVARAVSTDGGQTWGEVTNDPVLPDIWCQPNAVSLPSPQGQDRVVFANATRMLPFRGCGVLRLSLDGGESWSCSRTFNPGHYVYQCMCPLPDGTLGLLWENECQGLYFSRLPLSWFDPSLSLAHTPKEVEQNQ